ncbi:MAG: ImmA/IrrE family metallo-endopeptidase [Nitrospira sp.]|nr:ImmA/IrrE family metallo-endopeptidase [Nitrospira sp.]
MKTVSGLLAALIQWLRRPERFIQKLQAVYPHCQTVPFHNQEEAAANQGVELLETSFGPKIEGITTRDEGQVMIVLRRGLNPLNRQFVIAHELGHVHLHLPDMRATDAQLSLDRADHRDIEADAFALVWLMGSLPKERLEAEVFLYVLNNRGMAWRALRVICYVAWYHQRIRLAKWLERALLSLQAKGTA